MQVELLLGIGRTVPNVLGGIIVKALGLCQLPILCQSLPKLNPFHEKRPNMNWNGFSLGFNLGIFNNLHQPLGGLHTAKYVYSINTFMEGILAFLNLSSLSVHNHFLDGHRNGYGTVGWMQNWLLASVLPSYLCLCRWTWPWDHTSSWCPHKQPRHCRPHSPCPRHTSNALGCRFHLRDSGTPPHCTQWQGAKLTDRKQELIVIQFPPSKHIVLDSWENQWQTISILMFLKIPPKCRLFLDRNLKGVD